MRQPNLIKKISSTCLLTTQTTHIGHSTSYKWFPLKKMKDFIGVRWDSEVEKWGLPDRHHLHGFESTSTISCSLTVDCIPKPNPICGQWPQSYFFEVSSLVEFDFKQETQWMGLEWIMKRLPCLSKETVQRHPLLLSLLVVLRFNHHFYCKCPK